MAELRSRKPAQAIPQKQQEEDKSKSKPLKRSAQPDLEPNIFVVSAMFIVFSLVVGSLLWYKVDNRENGPFAAWVNEKYPAIDRALNRRSTPMFGASAQETTGELKLTEAELQEYTGLDEDKPIYLAINGTIFDVSVSPAFYGPGGHYHHFVGRDATRAWITECWDEDDQFTWRLEGVEAMFMPKWLDEQLEKVGQGDYAGLGGLEKMPKDMLDTVAKKAKQRFGSVTDKEKEKRRVEDVEEAHAKVQETLAHWVSFFSGNDKYKIVGTVIRDETRPSPPAPCEEAMKKRPVKGGKLENLMGNIGDMPGAGPVGAGGGGGKPKGEMPDFVKKKLAEDKAKAEKEAETVEEVELDGEEEEDLLHDEL